MGIDASIYSNIQTPQVNIPSPFDNAQKAMSLSQMAMQQQQMGLQFQTQAATRQAYANNTDQSGNVNQSGVLSELAKTNPMAATQLSQTFAAQNKAQAEAQAAQVDAAHKILSTAVPVLDDFQKNVPDDQKPNVWPNYVKNLQSMGVPTQNLPTQYDRDKVNAIHMTASKTKENLDNLKTQAETAKTYADIGLVPLQKAAEQFGSRSPNAELTGQYDKQAAPIRASQGAMNQMLDNYKNPSPQGDASLVLNAFKIKFPTAPDVNSLKELGESQATIDQWKNLFHKSASGGFDQATRNNLIRDGASTFRANVDTLRGVQQRYQARQQQQNVNDPTLTAEPAIDKTYSEAMALQKQIGPYVPPTERGGIMSGISNFASKVMGGKAEDTTNAGETAQTKKSATPAATDSRDASALQALKSMDPSSPKAFQLRAILKSKGLLK